MEDIARGKREAGGEEGSKEREAEAAEMEAKVRLWLEEKEAKQQLCDSRAYDICEQWGSYYAPCKKSGITRLKWFYKGCMAGKI